MMSRAKTSLPLLLFIAGIIAFSSWKYNVATARQTAVYSGRIHIEGAVQLDVILDPPVAQPGDSLNLQLTARNQDIGSHTPLITLKLPAQLNLSTTVLPAGATRNFQTNELTWRPVLAANGGSQQFALPLRVETIDMAQPEQLITAGIIVNGSSKQAQTPIVLGRPHTSDP